jgi:siroheme synthase (precorrin-2 oxidase/ferrochelatase)
MPIGASTYPATLAVPTSGCSPASASWLKAHAATHMGPELGELAEMLAGVRAELKAGGRSTEDVDWRPGLDWAMLDLIRTRRRIEAKERLQACLSQ